MLLYTTADWYILLANFIGYSTSWPSWNDCLEQDSLWLHACESIWLDGTILHSKEYKARKCSWWASKLVGLPTTSSSFFIQKIWLIILSNRNLLEMEISRIVRWSWYKMPPFFFFTSQHFFSCSIFFRADVSPSYRFFFPQTILVRIMAICVSLALFLIRFSTKMDAVLYIKSNHLLVSSGLLIGEFWRAPRLYKLLDMLVVPTLRLAFYI